MKNQEGASVQEPLYAELGRGSGYELTEGQKLALSDEAKIALATASEAMSQPFSSAKTMTETLLSLTQLERSKLVEANKELHRLDYAELKVDIERPGEVSYTLTDSGIIFLQEQVGLVS